MVSSKGATLPASPNKTVLNAWSFCFSYYFYIEVIIIKCPYMCKKTSVEQTSYKYGDDGQIVFSDFRSILDYELMTCLQENCGAFRDGKSCYNARS